MKRNGFRAAVPLILCAALLLSACGSGNGAASSDSLSAVPDSASSASESVDSVSSAQAEQILDTDALFSDRDLSQSYDEAAAVTVQLLGDTAACASDAVRIEGGSVTLTEEGVYLFTGTLADGQIRVDAGSKDKVQIVLAGVRITSSSSAAVYCREADKVFLTLAEGTENTLANGGTFAAIDENNIDAAVFSKTDLTLNGTGSLTITSPAGHGVVSKDELTITGGSYTVTAAKHGFAGKDSVSIADGCFAITSGKDGIHAENTDDAEQGFLYIGGGSFTIDAAGDGLSAGSTLQIDGGTFRLTTGGGSDAVTVKAGDGRMTQPFGMRDFTSGTEQSSGDAESCKGIKAGTALTVNDGTFVLDTADDAVHSNGDVTLCGGSWTIRTGDDGIHADGAVLIRAGEFSIPCCYEGVEGRSVTIDGGTLDIVAYDDGINAAGGTDGSGTAFGFGKQDGFAAGENCIITINGGSITIVSDGDSIDSNGSLTVNGGTLDLTCNSNGNTAIDTDGSFTHNGGEITTNDGSESGTGGMGGGMRGGMGGMNGGKTRGGMAAPPQTALAPETGNAV